MTERAGVLRSGPGLAAASDALRKVGDLQSARPGLAAWEATNLHALATALVTSAALRTETRGSHWREDYPDSSETWLGHLIVTRDPVTAARQDQADDDGMRVRFEPRPASGGDVRSRAGSAPQPRSPNLEPDGD